MRDFIEVLADLEKGQLAHDLTNEYKKMLLAVAAHGKAGELVIRIKAAPNADMTCAINASSMPRSRSRNAVKPCFLLMMTAARCGLIRARSLFRSAISPKAVMKMFMLFAQKKKFNSEREKYVFG